MNINSKEKQVSILGCGWFGFPLAKKLIEKGYDVKGSTTSIEKLEIFRLANINPFHISLNLEIIENEVLNDFLTNSEILIIAIPPKLRSGHTESFIQKIKNILPFIENFAVKKIVFISSTSVYGNELSDVIVTEETLPNPITESGKQILEVEQLLSLNTNFKTTIIRFGGLIGHDRHPVKFLAGKNNIENPNSPINLIRQNDCVEIVLKLIENNVFGEIFNVVTPFHPSRKEYYTQKAKELNLPLPNFNESNLENGKIISSDKIIKYLNYSFLEPKL